MKAGHIIMVDDDTIILNLNRMLMEEEGFDVECFEEPTQALARARETSFDFGILDYILPGIRGDRLAVNLRTIDPDIGIVVLSGYAEAFRVFEDLKLERCSVLLKPTDPLKLLDEMSKTRSILKPLAA